jgi:hypothetical protein
LSENRNIWDGLYHILAYSFETESLGKVLNPTFKVEEVDFKTAK